MIMLAILVSIILCLAFAPRAQAAEPIPTVREVSAHQVVENGDDVQEESQFTDRHTVRFDCNRDTGSIKIYRDGTLVNTTNDKKTTRDVKRQLPATDSTPNTAFRSSASRCNTAMNIDNITNLALWTAAGVAAAPSAGLSVTIGGFTTGNVLGAGSLFCKQQWKDEGDVTNQ